MIIEGEVEKIRLLFYALTFIEDRNVLCLILAIMSSVISKCTELKLN